MLIERVQEFTIVFLYGPWEMVNWISQVLFNVIAKWFWWYFIWPESFCFHQMHIFTMDFANSHVQVVGPRWHLFVEMGGPRGTCLRILHRGSFQNYASHRGRGALFLNNEQNLVEKGVLSNTSRNGTTDGTRNAHPRRVISRSTHLSDGF